jgi:tetratricopeptide (TPR) repeat protein
MNQRFGKGDIKIRERINDRFFLDGSVYRVDLYALIEQYFAQTIRDIDSKAVLFEQQGNFAAAIAAYDEIGWRFGPYGDRYIAMSLFKQGRVLEKQGKVEAAMAIYDEIARRFRNSYPSLKAQAFIDQAAEARVMLPRNETDEHAVKMGE